MIGLDTTAIIDLFKGNTTLKNKLDTLRPLYSTRINYFEIMMGLDTKKRQHQEEEHHYDEFFDALHVLELDKQSCKKATTLFHHLRRQGKEIGAMDCAVAGILLTQGITTIITKNKKHYENIPELDVVTY